MLELVQEVLHVVHDDFSYVSLSLISSVLVFTLVDLKNFLKLPLSISSVNLEPRPR